VKGLFAGAEVKGCPASSALALPARYLSQSHSINSALYPAKNDYLIL